MQKAQVNFAAWTVGGTSPRPTQLAELISIIQGFGQRCATSRVSSPEFSVLERAGAKSGCQFGRLNRGIDRIDPKHVVEASLDQLPVQHQIGFIGARNNHSLLAAETRNAGTVRKNASIRSLIAAIGLISLQVDLAKQGEILPERSGSQAGKHGYHAGQVKTFVDGRGNGSVPG